MEIEKARRLALYEMNHHGLLLLGWRLKFNSTQRALGRCTYKTKLINLSTYFLDKVSEVETRDTILHEIAHALEWIRHGTSGHGPKWKAICVEIGAKPTSKYNGHPIQHPYPYIIKCGDVVIHRLKKLPSPEALAAVITHATAKHGAPAKVFRVSYAPKDTHSP